jgi:catechol 2,3-dioxygenase-like lactoylglutathione lyase family enzyme
MMEQQVLDPVPRVVDHVGFAVADYTRSKAFYEKALAPLGVTLLMEFAGEAAGFGKSGRPSFSSKPRSPFHPLSRPFG